MVLCRACTSKSDQRTSEQPSPTSAPFLPLPTAATLLIHLITAVRTLPDYDTPRASRWIRCLVQICLDCHKQQQSREHQSSTEDYSQRVTSSDDREPPLQIIENITSQAIILARQSQHQQTDPHQRHQGSTVVALPPPYPAEELEWLATTLFNLGIDFYVSANNVYNSPSHNINNQENEHGADANAAAKKWTHLAVDIADVLAEYPSAIEGGGGEGGARGGGGGLGDQGLLSRVLRRKMKDGLGWVV